MGAKRCSRTELSLNIEQSVWGWPLPLQEICAIFSAQCYDWTGLNALNFSMAVDPIEVMLNVWYF